MVKANYTPQIDEKKVKESMSRKDQMQQPRTMIAQLLKNQEITEEPNLYKLGNNYLESAKKYASLHRKNEPKETARSEEYFEKESIVKESKYKNYMREQRVKE